MRPHNDFPEGPGLAAQPGYVALKSEIEAILFYEADLLDSRKFDLWLNMLADDLIYFMPMRYNVGAQHSASSGYQMAENTQQGQGISWFDEDKWTMTKRVEQIQTGHHYAEEPLSRTAHLITNVRILEAQPDLESANEVTVASSFLVQQNRVDYENYSFVGRRRDILKRDSNNSWLLHRRDILLEQSILLAKNLTTFF
jgi:3-phenylpropionate/cinnamic acid dioxygenase small subunit